MRVPARGMTDRSVRKRQQPPSLKRQEIMLRRWEDLVNGSSVGLESQVAGIRESPDSHSFLQNMHARCGRRKRNILNF